MASIPAPGANKESFSRCRAAILFAGRNRVEAADGRKESTEFDRGCGNCDELAGVCAAPYGEARPGLSLAAAKSHPTIREERVSSLSAKQRRVQRPRPFKDRRRRPQPPSNRLVAAAQALGTTSAYAIKKDSPCARVGKPIVDHRATKAILCNVHFGSRVDGALARTF